MFGGRRPYSLHTQGGVGFKALGKTGWSRDWLKTDDSLVNQGL
jgi:hypothetical protein